MNRPYLEPDFLQAVGEMTISFTLLDATLSHVFNAIEGNTDMSKIAAMPFGRKVDSFIEHVKFELERLNTAKFTADELGALKSELKGIASRRNSLLHDFWRTEETGRMTVSSLKGKNGVPEPYPTPAKIKRLAARTWAVRGRLTDLFNEHTHRRRVESLAKSKES